MRLVCNRQLVINGYGMFLIVDNPLVMIKAQLGSRTPYLYGSIIQNYGDIVIDKKGSWSIVISHAVCVYIYIHIYKTPDQWKCWSPVHKRNIRFSQVQSVPPDPESEIVDGP